MNIIFEKIKKQINSNPIILYMKGSPEFPACGFSHKAIKIISKCTKNFTYVDVLNNPDIRKFLPKFSDWPTFPQLWINGELVGGCDIIIEMYNCNELQKLIKNTIKK
ncbi:Glutaredoxin-4 [Candidatus Westeberhardia cardiocondylae]|uniref:Glutaredoxin n=1 Tax=Candidatus Westeberhardia cardiocondylae TaxID=1594731 RepID=A0A0H5BWV4_9ENTR|nr:Grx4 family monothiol glutaredoxin [Candidatus Westeberhardia cardiocondylae]MCR3756319.1 glutaredoxin 4 [Candidatus Westeberhardia cardiocondylae]CEN32220.1 Glutaredoxin-4 [Candidatus Westeberhardia cardiocondylae]